MPLPRTRTQLDYADLPPYDMVSYRAPVMVHSKSFWSPSRSAYGAADMTYADMSYGDTSYTDLSQSMDLGRTMYTTPNGCSMSYRLNKTFHDDPENVYVTEERKPKESRVRRALKELLGRSRKELHRSVSHYSDCRSESPRRRKREVHWDTSLARPAQTPRYYTSTTSRPMRLYQRAPSADAASLFCMPEAPRLRREPPPSAPPAPVRIHSFAVPEPRTVQFRRSKPKKHAFVNSHEWTLARSTSELRVGVVGAPRCGKTALIHRYLTGSFSAEESPEGGRFKKEVVLDGQSHILLIRDEGDAPPDAQLTTWVDAIILVYNVDCKESLLTASSFYSSMNKIRNLSEMPVLLVGTKDGVSERNPRVISEEQGKRMADQLRRCVYYETCATYGQNVERVFKDVCHRIVQQRHRASLGGSISAPRTPTPTSSHDSRRGDYQDLRALSNVYSSAPGRNVHPQQRSTFAPLGEHNRRSHVQHRDAAAMLGVQRGGERSVSAFAMPGGPAASQAALLAARRGDDYRGVSPSNSQKSIHAINGLSTRSSAALMENGCDGGEGVGVGSASTSHLPTPSSTPTTQRKKRISSLFFEKIEKGVIFNDTFDSPVNTRRHTLAFIQRPKDTAEEKTKTIEGLNMGIGRAIPIRQGELYKKSSKTSLNRNTPWYAYGYLIFIQQGKSKCLHSTIAPRNIFLIGQLLPCAAQFRGPKFVEFSGRDWKKKFVCLYADGRLAYHHNLKAYMEKGSHGKEIFLGLATVRVAGRQIPRNTQRMTTSATDEVCASSTPNIDRERRSDGAGGSGEGTSGGGSDDAKDTPVPATPNSGTMTSSMSTTTPQTVPGKKRSRAHRRLGSSGKHTDDDEECFEVVTSDATRWEFCAESAEERDAWVAAIEEQIEKALQSQSSIRTGSKTQQPREEVLALKKVAGNELCADCSTPSPVWASLNLGTLICIECCGIHRNLGSHISKVRSLELDDWPVEYLSVMQAIGNETANAFWEHNAPREKKPLPDSSREDKETWIRCKYEQKRYLPPANVSETVSRQLFQAVLSRQVAEVACLLARISPQDANAPLSMKDRRTPLHVACSAGYIEIVQLLLWNGADMMVLDEQGRSCRWHANIQGGAAIEQLLTSAGLPQDYGMNAAPNDLIHHSIPEVAVMGSLGSRDYGATLDDRDVVLRKNPSSKSSRNSHAFDLLPASII